MKRIDNNTVVSDLLAIKAGNDISFGEQSGRVEVIDFEETNTYWEIIFTLASTEKIYIRKEKTSC
ncbi:hypothetical protein EZJ43_12795 [Pedobacter changchengzhani]|uniref:Uncharacterized protein n=1 Tax=Pedobacter changchengzhani TaxID=2529274 RepID=A0A4R5MIP0_9SPHI|nr:hypothetical protein [Pedobacter changchengzhani]TDG35497.1 hypothetical protein EZJ43_12795 [Pedobacter changchengzhani]